MILVYITCEDEEQAVGIAERLLTKRLIACANMFPIKSFYFWQEGLKKDKEIVLIAKSDNEKFDSIQEEVTSIHSYEKPCVLKIDAEANPVFNNWLKDQLKQK